MLQTSQGTKYNMMCTTYIQCTKYTEHYIQYTEYTELYHIQYTEYTEVYYIQHTEIYTGTN